ncbi:MAG: AI-2E family transporter [Polyangiaceae bacterium]|nr:AI-2E family transporter [Polyangiaceae bacterium]
MAAILWLVRPVGMGIFLGMLMGFAFHPLYRRALGRWRPPVAALATVGASVAGVAATIGALGWLIVRDGTVLGRELLAALGPGGAARGVMGSMDRIIKRVGITTEDVAGRLRGLLEGAVSQAALLAEGVAAVAGSALLACFFAILTMYALLRKADEIPAAAELVLPLRPEYTRKLFAQLQAVGRQTLVGTVGSGLAQGLLSTVGYWIAGLPRPAFFGAASAVASLLPAVGTMLVWGPAGIALIALGHVGRGVFILAWGFLVVTSLNDYVIRPRLVGGQGGLPPLAMFVALFGGVAAMGLKGLIVGPVVMSLAFAVLRLYAEERRSVDRRIRADPAVIPTPAKDLGPTSPTDS